LRQVAAAKELAENPRQAAKVMKATFIRSPDFLSPEKQARNERILEAIDHLSDSRAVELACQPPTNDRSMVDEANKLDPECALRKDPDYARDFLIDQALDDERNGGSLKGWEGCASTAPASVSPRRSWWQGRKDRQKSASLSSDFQKTQTSEDWVKAEVQRRNKRREAWYKADGDEGLSTPRKRPSVE
jgi:hypothetical protein